MSYDLVVLGASSGGLRALQIEVKGLSKDFPLPVVVVLHRRSDTDETLRALLQKHTDLTVNQVVDKQDLVAGNLYFAPFDYHLLVEKGHLALSIEAPISKLRPAIDVLFESAADAYGSHVIGIILTGTNADGASGLASIKAAGGFTIVQDPETAEARTMPDAALAATTADEILPLDEIATFLWNLIRRGREHGKLG